ncbi:uncharacterized protein [Halyomorpha halys]
MKLMGEQLIKRDAKYWKGEDTVTNLQDGLKIGMSSKHLLGTTEIVKLGVNSENAIGVIPHTKIYREHRILGKVKPSIFGQREFDEIGIVGIKSQPPLAIIVPPSKQKVKIPENYRTVAAESIKKISNAIQKYFKDVKE